MAAELLRKALAAIAWTIGLIIVSLVGLYAGISDYLGNVSGLERLNYETRALIFDNFLGQFLGSLIPGATLVQTYALFLVMGKMLLLYAFFHYAMRVIRHGSDYRQQYDNEENRRYYSSAMIEDGIYAAMVFVPTGVIMWMDYELFKYRAMCDFLGMDTINMAEVVQQVPSWKIFIEENKHLQAANFVFIGALGYSMLAVGICLCGEICSHKMVESLTWPINLIENKVRSMFSGDAAAEDYYEAEAEHAYMQEDEAFEYTHEDGDNYTGGVPGDEFPGPAADTNADEQQFQRMAGPESYEVIGASIPRHVTREEAIQKPDRFFYHAQTDTVYDAAYYDAMHNGQD